MNYETNKNIKNLVSFLIIGFLPYLINIFMLPIYSRFVSQEEFGVIGLALAFLFITSSWSNLQLPGAIARIYFDYKNTQLKELISSLINSSAIICFLFCTFYLIFAEPLINVIYGSGEFYWLHFVVVCSVFLSCTNTAFEKLMITQQRGGALLVRSFVAQVVSVVSGVFFICYLKLGALGFMLSQSLYFFSIMVFSAFLIRSNYVFVLKKKYLHEGLKYSYPLIFHALGGVVFMYSGAFFIKNLVGVSAVGVFTIADRLSQIPKAIVNSFNNVYSPLYNKLRKRNLSVEEFTDSSQRFWSIVFGVFSPFFVFIASAFVDNYMFGEYDSVKQVLVILVPAYFFRSMFCFSSAPIFFNKDTLYIPIITCISGGLVLLVSFPVIKWGGVYGAAILVAFGFLITLMISELISRKKYSVRTFKSFYALAYFSIFFLNYLFLYLLDLESFVAVFIFSMFASLVNLLVLYWLNLFGLRDSISFLRQVNE